jgi:Tfp pilus assembly protein PilZ
MEQQRRSERNQGAWVAFYESEEGSYLNPVQDLSASGSFLRTSRPLRPGTKLEILLVNRAREAWVQMPAEVVWQGRKARHRGMGLRFLHRGDSLQAMRQVMGA